MSQVVLQFTMFLLWPLEYRDYRCDYSSAPFYLPVFVSVLSLRSLMSAWKVHDGRRAALGKNGIRRVSTWVLASV